MRIIWKIILTVIIFLFIYGLYTGHIRICSGSCKTIINPRWGLNFSKPQSIGVASYGLYNSSGAYVIATNEIIGNITFSNLSATTDKISNLTRPHGAGLQLNVMMKIVSTSNNTYVYWLQNIFQFDTDNATYNTSQIAFLDNIWNYTKVNSNMSNTMIKGNGVINYNPALYKNRFYFDWLTGWVTYGSHKSTLQLEPYIRLSKKSNKTIVTFGYKNSTFWFNHITPDNVTFNISTKSASLWIDPYNYTPVNVLYDAEFVFGGQCCLANSTYNSINANMWLYYSKNGTISPFNTLKDFGRDTGEGATNLSVMVGRHGAIVGIGHLNYSHTLFYNNS